RSVLVREMRPWKRTRLAPAWAARLSVPTVTVRRHRGLRTLRAVWATHRRATLRPARCWVKSKRTRAARLRLKRKVVPSGSLVRVALASLAPASQRTVDSDRPLRASAGGGLVPLAGAGGAGTTLTVRVALALSPVGSVAVSVAW